MSAPEVVGLCVGCTVLAAFLWRVVRALYRIVRIGETALGRLVAVEAQLKNNGGNSARDMLDKIHAVAMENAEANTRVEAEQRRAAHIAGQAAQAAATAQQEAVDARRGVNALRADVDAMMKAVLSDHAGIWDSLAQIDPRLDRRRGEADPTV